MHGCAHAAPEPVAAPARPRLLTRPASSVGTDETTGIGDRDGDGSSTVGDGDGQCCADGEVCFGGGGIVPGAAREPSTSATDTRKPEVLTFENSPKALARFVRAQRKSAEEEEAVRDLCRAREDAKQDETAAKNRLSEFLLRKGVRYPGKNAWTAKYWKWLSSVCFELEDFLADPWSERFDDGVRYFFGHRIPD